MKILFRHIYVEEEKDDAFGEKEVKEAPVQVEDNVSSAEKAEATTYYGKPEISTPDELMVRVARRMAVPVGLSFRRQVNVGRW